MAYDGCNISDERSVGRLGVRVNYPMSRLQTNPLKLPHFMQQLIDGDLASKNGSRKWLGGTGTDINQTFASIIQSEFIDPFIPELRNGFRSDIHTVAPLAKRGDKLGFSY